MICFHSEHRTPYENINFRCMGVDFALKTKRLNSFSRLFMCIWAYETSSNASVLVFMLFAGLVYSIN